MLSDPNENWKEEEYTLPAAPREAALREFSVSATTPHRFYVDEDSLSVGEDGVVRFVLVVRSAGGATNVTFEGIRCVTGERRLYASGRANGEWSPARNSAWEPIVDNSYDRPRAALAYDYLCDGPAPPRNRAAALKLLKTSQPGFRHLHEGIVR
ncbi:hypothetical protein E6C76_18255 [Pseudothauera nasutitermitis]|uniref:CNP1-like uncharacterized domain-containing protein n=1 Tax=Pseudothauera nasutitermitis TaxID=2565930 RepID=A0A4S4ARM8_9RHOO|nr:hypothetical protein E6C76_18255 [Pseudothauera nasutitermitis]